VCEQTAVWEESLVATERDYYQILEVSRDASEKDIKRAYHRLARERHPDKGTTPEQIKRLQEGFALISTAYNVLKDKDKRAEYDVRVRKEDARRGQEGGGEPSGGRAPAAATGTAAVGAAKATGGREERIAIAQRAYTKGVQLFNAGDYSRACEFFEAAIKNNDNEALYHVKLGLALMRSRQGFNRAVTAIQRAIELDPYNVDHRLALGEIYETVGSTSLAIKAYQDLLKWDATNAKALERLSALGAGTGRSLVEKVLKLFKRH
jgi:curved DNA-binding protein CbpA